jgi:hypothetical protein
MTSKEMSLRAFIAVISEPVHLQPWMRQYVIDALTDLAERRESETRAERIEEDTAGLPLTVEDWVAERLANTTRIAMTKTGADRASWIEDGRYWRLIYDRLRLKTGDQHG